MGVDPTESGGVSIPMSIRGFRSLMGREGFDPTESVGGVRVSIPPSPPDETGFDPTESDEVPGFDPSSIPHPAVEGCGADVCFHPR